MSESASDQELIQPIDAPPDEALAAVGLAAEMWSAAWEEAPGGGRLHLPVLAGIRHGRLLARVEVRERAGGSEVRLQVDHADYEVNRPAVFFLALGAAGGLITILLPLYPKQLIAFLPLAVVLLLGAWLLVASRVRSAGPQDFLDMVAELAEVGSERASDPEEREPIRP